MPDLSAAAPDEPDPAERLEAGRKLFSQACDFVAGVADLARLPPMRLPEVAFAGRSNVGKSSLVNALTGRRQLARTSQTPGRTQQINLFDLGGRLTLVDLPGYGYAQAPKPAVQAWQELVRAYLRGRASLRRTCVLVDARHGLKDNDRAFMTMLGETALAYAPAHPGFAAHAWYLLADVAARPEARDADRAESAYRRALALAEARAMHPLVAHCHLGLGRLARSAQRDPEAKEHLATAGEMYRAMAMEYWARRAEEEPGPPASLL